MKLIRFFWAKYNSLKREKKIDPVLVELYGNLNTVILKSSSTYCFDAFCI